MEKETACEGFPWNCRDCDSDYSNTYCPGAEYDRWLADAPNINATRISNYVPRQPKERKKDRARGATQRAVRRKQLIPEPCEVCGATKNVQGHHDDYDNPLEVRWLCPSHHQQLHAELRKAVLQFSNNP